MQSHHQERRGVGADTHESSQAQRHLPGAHDEVRRKAQNNMEHGDDKDMKEVGLALEKGWNNRKQNKPSPYDG